MTTAATFDGWNLTGTTPGGGRTRILSIDGWISRDLRRTRTTRGAQDGDFPSQGQNAGRAIVVTGHIDYGTDAATAAIERRQIVALGGNGLATFTTQDAGLTLTAQVEVDSIKATPIRDSYTAWTLALHAPDPLVYGPAVYASTGLGASGGGTGRAWPRTWPRTWGVAAGTIPGALSIPNTGTATYWPRLRIAGPVTNPVVTVNETGDTLRYAGTLASGQWLDVDLPNRKVLLQGQVSVMTAITYTGNWLGIPKRGASVSFTGDTADPAALLSVWAYESAWN